MILHNLNNEDLKSKEDVIKELQEMGVQIIYKPIALVESILESSTSFGEKSIGFIEMDIHEALRKIKIRKSVIGDPFS